MQRNQILGVLAVLALGALAAFFVLRSGSAPSEGEPGAEAAAAADYPRGPHNGRLLTDGDVAVEVTIFETDVPPEFRVFPMRGGKPLAPSAVDLTFYVRRLDAVDTVRFEAVGDYLRSTSTIYEPHSFAVAVEALVDGRAHRWTYDSFEGRLTMPASAVSGANVGTAVAGPAEMTLRTQLTGEITVNADRVARVVPRVSGVVVAVRKNLGETVRAGEVLAVIESREVSDARSAYLTAVSREALARTTAERERQLFERNVSPELDLLTAQRALAEAEINRRAALASLSALGLSPGGAAGSLTRFEVRAPFGGTVTEKSVSLGEAVSPERTLFVVADLSTVWVEATLYPRDLPNVRPGQRATVTLPDADSLSAEGTVSYVGAVVGEGTRTARARIVLPNRNGRWRPGLFVDVALATETARVPLAVREEGLQSFREFTVVYAQVADTFEVRMLDLGRRSNGFVEVLGGLKPGTRYATANSFVLKADLGKSGATHDH